MKVAPIPPNEAERLSSLYEYNLLDTLPEEEYDNITRIASEICNVPISLITLLDTDRQYFKSVKGMNDKQTSREVSFCSHAILSPNEMLIVPDSSQDDRFHDNPLVTCEPHVAFYAGVPLVNESGHAMGTLCVLDRKPRELTNEQKETLRALASQIVTYFELRKKNFQLDKQKAELELLNKELERFAYVAAHDLKSPCNNLKMIADLLKTMYADKLDADGEFMLNALGEASGTLSGLIDGILLHTKAVNSAQQQKQYIRFGDLMEEMRLILDLPKDFSFTYDNADLQLYVPKPVLQQVLLNLCTNAIKYNDKAQGTIHVSVEDKGEEYIFSVADNGKGIPASQQEQVFELFTILGTDNKGQKGNGIGLSTVKRLIEKYGGTISLSSEEGKGTTFYFSIDK
jgi:signal transduction histidine kinase